MAYCENPNKSPDFTSLMAGVSLMAIIASLSAPAFADDADTKAEIRALKEQLRRLERRLEAQEQGRKRGAAANGANAVVVKGEEPPAEGDARFWWRDVAITPDGFFEFGALYRNRYIGADIATPFGQIPYSNNPTSYSGETRFTARRSRFILYTDADLDNVTHARMYLATDFLGAAQTATLTQSDSFNFRFRELYLKVDRSDLGLHLAAGQMYTLISMNSKGTTPDTFLTPPVIDDQYMPGYTWARQPGVRVSKDLPFNLQWAFGAESSYTSFVTPGLAINGVTAPVPANAVSDFGPYNTLPGVFVPGAYIQTPVAGSLYNTVNNITFNDVPDLMTKASWDPEIFGHAVHVEGGGVLRDFKDRLYGGTHNVWGGAALVGVIVSVIPKWLDFQVSGISGRGIGRYGAASLPDATFDVTDDVQPIHERQAMIGVIAHPTPKTDLYVFAGGEFAGSQYSWGRLALGPFVPLNTYSFGYGNPAFNNLGCNFEGASALTGTTACVGQTKDVRQVTAGVWHNFYDGPAGKIRLGAQYSYTVRDSFPGVGGAFKGTDNMIFTSFRYYPFNAGASPPIVAKY